MSKIKVYISAPVTGYDLIERREYFDTIETALNNVGCKAVNPLKGVPDNISRETAMRRDIEMLLRCDMVLAMDGWQTSRGCMLEIEVARQCGIFVLNKDLFDIGFARALNEMYRYERQWKKSEEDNDRRKEDQPDGELHT